jgi:hypothetical protein
MPPHQKLTKEPTGLIKKTTKIRYIRAVFVRNPICRWAQDHVFHYRHIVAYALSLCEEYTFRFEKKHACQEHLEWLKLNEPKLESGSKNLRSPPCCMGKSYKVDPKGFFKFGE